MKDSDRIKVGILRALSQTNGPAGGSQISERLMTAGLNLRPRTIRHYLLDLDRNGLTRFVSRRRGRELTEKGRNELKRVGTMDRLGLMTSKIDTLEYRMSFNCQKGTGTVVTDAAIVGVEDTDRTLIEFEAAMTRGLAMGSKSIVAREGEKLGDLSVSPGSAIFGTVSSVTAGGILVREGIPVTSRFGGLLDIRNGEPAGFLELIEYRGTTDDPVNLFVNAGMTSVRECISGGSGVVGASFCEVPAESFAEVRAIRNNMIGSSLGGIFALGRPSQPLAGIAVNEDRIGMIVLSGLNPMAAAVEAGISLTICPLAGIADFSMFGAVVNAGKEEFATKGN